MPREKPVAETPNGGSVSRLSTPAQSADCDFNRAGDGALTSPTADELLAGATVSQMTGDDLRDAETAPTAEVANATSRTRTNHWDRTPAEPSSLPQIEGYEVRAKLGGGGMGEVFRAQDVALRTDVAIKCPRSLDETSRRLFLQEARQLAQVKHINVVSIRNFGECAGRVYFTMDLIDGPTGDRMIELFRTKCAVDLSGAEILKLLDLDPARMSGDLRRAASFRRPYFRIVAIWMAEAADGLAAAHAKKILHRDVKPHNFLLSRDGRMMVTDFGLARDDKSILCDGAQGVAGTLPYVAPERIVGDWAPTDARADIWALGASLFEFLTFRRAYPENSRRVLQHIASSDAPAPRSIVPAVPGALNSICVRAMRRDPAGRFQESRHLAEALRRFALRSDWRSPRRLAIATMALVAAAGSSIAVPLLLTDAEPRPAVTDPVVDGGPVADGEEVGVPPTRGEAALGDSPVQKASTLDDMRITDTSVAATQLEPRLLLLANQDLNTDLEGNEQPGGVAQSILREQATGQFGQRVKILPVPSAGTAWTRASAIDAAMQGGGNHVALIEVKCRARRFEIRRDEAVIRDVAERGPGWFARAITLSTGDTTCRIDWNVEVSAQLIDVAGGTTLWTRAIEDHIVRDYCAREFDGDLHKRLIRELWTGLAAELDRLLPHRDEQQR